MRSATTSRWRTSACRSSNKTGWRSCVRQHATRLRQGDRNVPRPDLPEHRHPPFDGTPGKEETFRCRRGLVYLYLEGPPAEQPSCWPAKADRGAYTVWHEVVLRPGEQQLVSPNTLHWFQAGPDGAIVSEFSTQSRDDLDVFTDPDIARTTVVTSNWVSAGGEGEDAAAAAHR